MTATLPEFADYHRTIVGFHGTRQSVAESLVLGKGDWLVSKNDHDWLGNGVYFWEHAPRQAWWWADRIKKRKQKSKNPDERKKWGEDTAVLGAMIRLGTCLDLLDPPVSSLMKKWYDLYSEEATRAKVVLPRNTMHKRFLDCRVFEFAYEQARVMGQTIQSSRGVYAPTDAKLRLWPGSWLAEGAHVQVCVRPDAIKACILGVWLVRPEIGV